MSNDKLITAIDNLQDAIYSLKESVERLHTIQSDIFNADTSHDDMQSLKSKLQSLIDTINKKID